MGPPAASRAGADHRALAHGLQRVGRQADRLARQQLGDAFASEAGEASVIVAARAGGTRAPPLFAAAAPTPEPGRDELAVKVAPGVFGGQKALAAQHPLDDRRDVERRGIPGARRHGIEGVAEDVVVDDERLEARRGPCLHVADARQKPRPGEHAEQRVHGVLAAELRVGHAGVGRRAVAVAGHAVAAGQQHGGDRRDAGLGRTRREDAGARVDGRQARTVVGRRAGRDRLHCHEAGQDLGVLLGDGGGQGGGSRRGRRWPSRADSAPGTEMRCRGRRRTCRSRRPP